MHSDYGVTLDSDISRLRMEVSHQQKSLLERLNLSRFKAKQTTQEIDLAKNDLERLMQSIKNRTHRYQTHEKPLKQMKEFTGKASLGSGRDNDTYSSHSRRNLDTYQKLYFQKMQPNNNLPHNDNDPFNINMQSDTYSRPPYAQRAPEKYRMDY